MDTIILDASVAVKWFFEEEASDKADLLMNSVEKEQIEALVPEIFYSEFASSCWKKIRNKEAAISYGIRALESLTALPLKRYSVFELADVALVNALQYKISVYDALYVALAEVYVAPLVTADETLLKACRGRFDFIEPLSEFSLS